MYKELIKGWIKHIDFMLLDILSLEMSLFIAYTYRNKILWEVESPEIYRTLAVMIILLDICVVFFNSSYESIIRRGYLVELKKVMVHCALVVVGIIVWMFFTKQSSVYSRIIILSIYPLSVCFMTAVRVVWKKFLRMKIQEKKELRKIMVITTQNRAKTVLEGLLQPFRDYQISAIALYDTTENQADTMMKIPVLNGEDQFFDYVREYVIDEIFIDLRDCEENTEKLTNLLVSMGFVVHVNLSQFTSGMENKKVNSFGKYVVLSSGIKFASAWQVLAKRGMDICGALVGLLITGVACLIYGPIIKHQSPGPIFFSQERVGRNGRTFKIYKFRTMYPDAEERKKELLSQNKMQGLMFKMDNDPRIIPIGHFLRKSSIDELPQFWNVLKGEMSLVGTRPPTVDEYKQYGMRHRKRLAMKPGITGMWQVSGRSDIVDFEEVVALDAKYIEEWNLSMDIKILWQTVKIVLTGKGAV